MRSLLYLDLLGVRSEWADRGREGAEDAFDRFRQLAREVVQDYESSVFIEGGIESDSLALSCISEIAAARVGMDIYRRAFRTSTEETDPRMWVRGAIVLDEGEALRTSARLDDPFSQIEVFSYSGALLDAISAERSGIKGMRLLVHQQLVSIELQDEISVEFDGRRVETILQLPYTPSPPRIEEEGYQDLLWMASPEDWEPLQQMMAQRLQWAVKKSSEEFVQAAATQVIFHECEGLIHSV